MATVSITVPDAWVPQIVTALKRRYPDLTGTDAAVGREGVARMVRETLRASEGDRITRDLQASLESQRASQLATVDAVLSQIV